MRVSLRVLLGAVVLAVAIVLLAPATLLDAPLTKKTDGRLHLVDATGFWWRGAAVLATRDDDVRVPLGWRIAFAPLVTGKLVVVLRAIDDPSMPTGTLQASGGTIEVHDLRLAVPAALLQALVPALGPLAPRGDIDVRAPSFTWRRGAAGGTLDVTWQHAGVAAAALSLDLGRVNAHIAPAGDGVAGDVRNAGGDVAVDGTVALRGGIIDVSIALKPTRQASDALRAMLPLLGPPDAAGGIRLAWRSDQR